MRNIWMVLLGSLCIGWGQEPSACNLHAPSHPIAAGTKSDAKTSLGFTDRGREYWVGPAQNGTWFDPVRNGEGWVLQILDDGSAVFLWYTYRPEGGQAWIIGQGGTVTRNTITFEQTYTTRGARFGAAFNPSDVVLEPWGRVSFTFDNCNSGSVDYRGPEGWGAARRALTRLTRVAEQRCDGVRALTTRGARAPAGLRQISGAWFDPARSGEGWTFEELGDGQVATTWFTYDAQGRQAWMFGVGRREGSQVQVAQVLRSQGARFGAAFDPTAVTSSPWGSLVFELANCAGGRAEYAASAAGFDNGQLGLGRLTRLASMACLDTFAPASVQGAWQRSANLAAAESEVSAAMLGIQAFVVGGFRERATFQRYDLGSGAAVRLRDLPSGRDHTMSLATPGKVWVFGGYASSADNAYRYDIATDSWQTLGGFPGAVASGAALLNGRMYVGDAGGQLLEIDPLTLDFRTIAAGDSVPRDHSQLVAYLGELWMLGGRMESLTESRVSIYDPGSGRWRAAPPMNIARAGFAAAVVADQLHVAGGEVLRQTAPAITLGQFEVLAAGADAWSPGPILPVPVHGVAGATSGGRFRLLGGSTLAGGARNGGEVQVFVPTP